MPSQKSSTRQIATLVNLLYKKAPLNFQGGFFICYYKWQKVIVEYLYQFQKDFAQLIEV
jgi:hypothetical protein